MKTQHKLSREESNLFYQETIRPLIEEISNSTAAELIEEIIEILSKTKEKLHAYGFFDFLRVLKEFSDRDFLVLILLDISASLVEEVEHPINPKLFKAINTEKDLEGTRYFITEIYSNRYSSFFFFTFLAHLFYLED